MRDWYNDYYRAIRTSRANARFCELVYGHDLGQHGFMDEPQLRTLLDVLALQPGELSLDLGCGDGRIAEHISDATGARLVGVDNCSPAIESAVGRARPKRDRLAFALMELGQLGFAPGVFDSALAVDSLYFSSSDDTIGEAARVLRPDGRLAVFYSHEIPSDGSESKDTLESDRTPPARTLVELGFDFVARDFTEVDYEHMQRRKVVLATLKDDYSIEGNAFIFENRLGEANGISRAIEEGRHRRYLYLAWRARSA